jgi:hypothetical protein
VDDRCRRNNTVSVPIGSNRVGKDGANRRVPGREAPCGSVRRPGTDGLAIASGIGR